MHRWFLLLSLALCGCDPEADAPKEETGDTTLVETAEPAETGDTADSGDTGPVDDDHDTYSVEGGDCDDADPTVHPGATEVWYDGIDQDCNGDDGDQDADGNARSGYGGTDCNDDDASIFPGAQEVCDGVDQDCDGAIDEDASAYWFADGDGDAYGDPERPLDGCDGALGYVTNADDCDDERSDVSPVADDVCDGKDNNCDGATDEGWETSPWYRDADNDGYGDSSIFVAACYDPAGYVESWKDCDDDDAAVNPGEAEVCDGADNDCDGDVDPDDSTDAATWNLDVDGDGYGDASTGETSCSQPADRIADADDCDDLDAAVHPGAVEVCDEVDDDCDGAIRAAGTATWWDAAGAATDLTATLSAGTVASPVVIGDDTSADVLLDEGELSLCDGTWYLQVELSSAATDLTISGYGGATVTTLTTATSSGGPTGPVVSVVDATLTLEGVTITDGNGASGRVGGGLVASRSLSFGALPTTPTVTLIESVVEGNSTRYGGGIAVYGYAWVDLIDSLVTGNEATIVGGGFWLQSYGAVSCSASTLGAGGILANTAPVGGGGYLTLATSGSVDSVGCDWGEDAAGDDNAAYDLQQTEASGSAYCYGNALALTDTVSCAGGACTASTDATCP